MIKKITYLKPTPPEPTFEKPHIQLDWLWGRYVQRYKNKKTRDACLARLEAYKRVMTEVHGYDDRLVKDNRFYLSVHWDYFALYNAEKYWRSRGLSSQTIHSYIKALRNLMQYAARNGLTSVVEFLDPRVNAGKRETKRREAYDDQELEFIRKVISPTIKYVTRILAGYKPTGVGTDPRSGKAWRDSAHKSSGKWIRFDGSGIGWTHWDNLVWYFENVMNCRPVVQHKIHGAKISPIFWQAANKYHGGPSVVWLRLGVAPLIDSKLIVPLAIKLALETGLNPESICKLKRNCYRDSHPLTGLPYIRYYKERSTGEKDLHLALFDADNQDDYHLLQKQSEIIKRTIRTIIKLTEPLVGNARKEDRDYLFLMEAIKRRNSNEVFRLNGHTIHHWVKGLKNKAKKTVRTVFQRA
jgi:hypothetical protein